MLDRPDPAARFADALARAEAMLAAADPALAAVIAAVGPCRLAPEWGREPYESLIRAVAHQQVHARAAEAILGRFVALWAPAPFPAPEQVAGSDDAALRGAGLSFSKIAAIRDIAAKAAVGLVPDRAAAEAMDDEALVEQLLPVRGVGRWTVQMLLIFSLGRLDVLPVDDFGIRTGMALLHRLDTLPPPRALPALAEPWRPFRSVACWYLWRHVELTRASLPASLPRATKARRHREAGDQS